jgi:glyoxylase-like metal-dependent hydrolase (beta-lactamase superfamily II)
MREMRAATAIGFAAMSHGAPLRVGSVEVSLVCEGWAPLSLDDEAPGRSVDWAAERRRHPWAYDAETWRWHVHAFVLRTPEGTVVVDSGLGPFPPYRPWKEQHDDAWEGIDRAAVGHVILTHMHADHAGGSTDGSGEASFPNAVYHVHPGDWSAFEHASDPDDYVARSAMSRLHEQGALDLGDLDREVAPGVHVRHTPGHTPGHQSVVVEAGSEVLLLTGDLLHLPIQVLHPSWRSSHDVDPGLGQAARQVLLWRARHDGWVVAVSHFAHPFGRVDEDGWTSLGA